MGALPLPVVLAALAVALTGAGATFPYPLYSKWFSTYAAETGVRINYQSIGSGEAERAAEHGEGKLQHRQNRIVTVFLSHRAPTTSITALTASIP